LEGGRRISYGRSSGGEHVEEVCAVLINLLNAFSIFSKTRLDAHQERITLVRSGFLGITFDIPDSTPSAYFLEV
jgi:hypothetical protein